MQTRGIRIRRRCSLQSRVSQLVQQRLRFFDAELGRLHSFRKVRPETREAQPLGLQRSYHSLWLGDHRTDAE